MIRKPLHNVKVFLYRMLEVIRNKQVEKDLWKILKKEAEYRGVVVFPPTISWRADLFQRPHQLALALARQGYLVFFCEPLSSNTFKGGFHKIKERLYVSVCELSVYHSISKPIVFTLAYNREALAHFQSPKVVYEYIDELEVLEGDLRRMYRDHDFLVQNSAVVVSTAERLYQRITTIRPDALLLPNAVDYHFFCKKIESTNEPPEDLKAILNLRHNVVGYYGSLAKWFDYPMLIHAARLRPDLEFVLIGMDYDGSVLKSGMEEYGNIHWLGPKLYEDLPAYLKYFDIAMIPFLVNEITQSTSPIKLYEYWSARKPVVTTAMHECIKVKPLAIIASDPEDFINKLDEALHIKEEPEYIAALDRAAADNTWDQRARQILTALGERAS